MIQLFDTHVHLQDRAFNSDREDVLDRATDAGVTSMVVIGESESSSERAVGLATRHERCWSAVGMHPHHATALDSGFIEWLAAMAANPRVVAIGEIGLDYHYDRSPRDVQRDAFALQLGVASTMNLPVSIHSRSALEDTLAIVGSWSRGQRQQGVVGPLGVMHCFGYDTAAATRFVELGLMISIPGTVTYPRADVVQQVARAVPIESLVIETDAPVLAPQAHRGRRNEPSYLRETAERVAVLRGVSIEEIADRTSRNARRLFKLPIDADDGTVVESVSA
jgi:TatD DNase family protein